MQTDSIETNNIAEVQQQPLELKFIQDSFKEFKASFDKKKEDLPLLLNIQDIFQKVNQAAEQGPSQYHRILSDINQKQDDKPDPVKKFFFEEFVGGVAKRLITVSSVSKDYLQLTQNVLLEIAKTFVHVIGLPKDQAESADQFSDLADAMRYVFDENSSFYQKHFLKDLSQAQQSITNKQKEALDSMEDEERKWRESFEVDMLVDCIKYDHQFSVKMWSKAQIVSKFNGGSHVKVRFLKDVKAKQEMHRVESDHLAPYNSKTEADDIWRRELKKGDVVDALSSTGSWHASTIVFPEERDIETCAMPMCKVGFRTYKPDGDREDAMGKYHGMSESVDEMIGQFTCRIQRRGTFVDMNQQMASQRHDGQVVGGGNSGQYQTQVIQDETDMDLIKEENQKIFAVERHSCRSTVLTSILNFIGEKKGFENILQKIQDESTSLDTTFYLVDCMKKSVSMFHKQFVDEFFDALRTVVQDKILNAPEQSLKNLKRERVEELLVSIFERLLTRLRSSLELTVEKHILNTEIGVRLLQQNALALRIDGAKMINEVCKQLQISQTLTPAEKKTHQQALVKKFKEKNLLTEFYDAKRTHIQLISRSGEFLKLMIVTKSLSEQEKEQVWSCIYFDEETKIELYKVISDILGRFESEDLLYFQQKLVSIDINSIGQQEINLISEIAKVYKHDSNAHKIIALEFMWKLLFESNSKLTQEKSMTTTLQYQFSFILNLVDFPSAYVFIKKMAENLTNNNKGYLTVKILGNYIREFTGSATDSAKSSSPAGYTALRTKKQTNSAAENVEMKDETKEPEDEEQIMEVDQQPEQFGPEAVKDKQDMVKLLDAELELLNQFFKNFVWYNEVTLAAVEEQLKKKPDADLKALADTPLCDMYNHKDQVTERMEFLTAYMSKSANNLSVDQLDMLWSMLIDKSKLPIDHQIMYKWLQNVCDEVFNYNKSIVDKGEFMEFFKQKTSASTTDFSNLTVDGYYCIQSFFIVANTLNRKLIVLSDETKGSQGGTQKSAYTSFNNSTGAQYKSYSFTQVSSNNNNKGIDPQALEIEVRAEPNEMEGIQGLWKIALDAQDTKVGACVTSLLLQLHTNVDFEMESRIPEFEDQFLQSCVDQIKQQIVLIKQRTEEEKQKIEKDYADIKYLIQSSIDKVLPMEEKRIIKCVTYIKMLIQNSEKDGTFGLRPHAALGVGEPIKIEISNVLQVGMGHRSKFELMVPNSLTFLEFKKLVAWEIAKSMNSDGVTYTMEKPKHPISFKVTKQSTATVIKDQEHGQTLKQCLLRNKDVLSVTNKGSNTVSKAPLLNDEGTELNARARFIFTQLFNDYAIQDPDQPDRKVMMHEQCGKFITGVTGEECLLGNHQLNKIMSDYDSDADGKMTLDDFLQFYKINTTQKLDTVRKNLVFVHYRHDLKREPLAGQDDNVLQSRAGRTQMPRYKLSSNQESFDLLQSLLDMHPELYNKSLELLNILCTSPAIYDRVLKLENGDGDGQIFDKNNPNISMYTLEIIDSFIQKDRSSQVQFSTEDIENMPLIDTWIQRFLEKDGFTQMLNLFEGLIQEITQSAQRVESMKNKEKSLLELLMKLIRILILLLLQSDEPEVASKLLLARNKSSTAGDKDDKQDDQKNDKNTKQEGGYSTPTDDATAKEDALEVKDQQFVTPEKQTASRIPFINASNMYNQQKEQDLKAAEDTRNATEAMEKMDIQQKTNNLNLTAEDIGITMPTSTDVEFEHTPRFNQLVQRLRDLGIAESIIKQIDFEQLQNMLLTLITVLIQKTTIKIEDRKLIETALDLWATALVQNESLIDQFYKWTTNYQPLKKENKKDAKATTATAQSNEETADIGAAFVDALLVAMDPNASTTKTDSKEKVNMVIRDAKDFILYGVCAAPILVNEAFQQNLQVVSLQVNKNQGQKPILFLINMLKDTLFNDTRGILSKDCGQFFELFSYLLSTYNSQIEKEKQKQKLENDKNKLDQEMNDVSKTNEQEEQIQETTEGDGQDLDLFGMLKETITQLKRYHGIEKQGQITADKLLVGYLELTKELLIGCFEDESKYDELVQLTEEAGLMHELFYENLFYSKEHTKSDKQNKCKSKGSRTIAYKLIFRYCKAMKPKELSKFFKDYLWPYIADFPRPIKWRHQPSDKMRTQYVGIYNLGNICYMNSMLQQFYMVPQFRYQLLKAVDTNEENMVEHKGLKFDDNIIRQLQKMFSFLELSERQYYDPTEFCYAFKDLGGNPTNTSIQCDAQEFLNIFFDRIENGLAKTSQKNLLQDVFRGKSCSQLICKECGYTRNNVEYFYTLTVEVKNRNSLQESLSKSVEPTEIQDFRCEGCNQRVDIQKRTLLGKTPNVLIVHLQRIVFSFETYENEKINTRFEFPNILNLEDYSFQEACKREQTPTDSISEDMKDLIGIEKEEYEYRLVGVNIHCGTAQHGHYYSLINTKRGKDEPDSSKQSWNEVEKDQWRCFDDETNKYQIFKNIADESFGGDMSGMSENEIERMITASKDGLWGKSAYMLVYERKKKSNLTEVVLSKEQEQEEEAHRQALLEEARKTLGRTDTAEPRAEPEKVKEEDEKMYPYDREVDYRQINQYIPKHYRDIVNKDNSEFVVDRQIFQEQFFNLVKLLLEKVGSELLLTQYKYGVDYYQYFDTLKTYGLEIGRKVMFDFLSHYYANISMSNICDSLGSIATFSDSHVSFTSEIQSEKPSFLAAFIQKTYLDDQCSYFFEIMFQCVDQTARYYIAKMTSVIINRAFKMYSQCEDKKHPKCVDLYDKLTQFMKLVFEVIKTKECQSNWSKFSNFLIMLEEIGNGGLVQQQLLLSEFDDIVADLCDFVLMGSSPRALKETEPRIQMGGAANPAPFAPIIELVSTLIRLTLTYTMLQAKGDNFDYRAQGLPELTDIDLAQSWKHFELTEEAYNLFTQEKLLQDVLANTYCCKEYGEGLAHLCYRNRKLTKGVYKVLMKGIVQTNDYERIKNYLEIIAPIVKVKDELQQERLEWIFGFPYLEWYQPLDPTKRTEVGLETNIQHSIKKMVFEMKSMLNYDQQMEGSLLYLLWKYHKTLDKYTVTCLEQLFGMIASDENISAYFASLPGPNYQYARYTDWIKPFLDKMMKSSSAGGYMKDLRENIVRVISLFTVYEVYLKKIDNQTTIMDQDDPASAKKRLNFDNVDDKQEEAREQEQITEQIETTIQKNEQEVSNSVIRCNPQPYIILRTKSEKDMSQNFSNGVLFTINQLEADYMMSQPTGETNLAIPDSYLNKYSSAGQRKAADIVHPNQRANQMQQSAVQEHYSSSGVKKKLDEKLAFDKQCNGQQAEMEQQDSQKIKVVEEADTEMKNENADEGYAQDNEGDPGQQQSAQQDHEMTNSTADFAKPTVSINVDEIKSKGSFDDFNQDQIYTSQDLIYKLSVQNTYEAPIKYKVKITVKEGYKASEVNLRWPQTGIKGTLKPNDQAIIALLPKIVPNVEISPYEVNDIEKLNFNFSWKEDMDKFVNLSNTQDSNPAQDTKKDTSKAVRFQTENQLAVITETNDYQKNDAAAWENPYDFDDNANAGQEKNCPACTVFNPISATICYVCDQKF